MRFEDKPRSWQIGTVLLLIGPILGLAFAIELAAWAWHQDAEGLPWRAILLGISSGAAFSLSLKLRKQ